MGIVTVWLADPPPMHEANAPEVVHRICRQSLAMKMAEQAKLEVACYEGENGGGVLVGISGRPRQMAKFLEALAEQGIGGLTVDLSDLSLEEQAVVKEAADKAAAMLAFELVDVGEGSSS
ncbi:MAG: hypothetical protein AB1816_00600 [Bacillota bacterium]